MRLLNTNLNTLKIAEFFGDAIPSYAILSHTWGKEEVSFYDMHHLSENALKDRTGYLKIKRSCEIARERGYSYIWIDTCCIDKTSSAELSEAINSMYGYYRDSQVCFAYLADVFGTENPKRLGSAFRESRWFRRGWTLQELLAPLSLVFFSHNWEDIGTKPSLKVVISEVTGIPVLVLLNSYPGTISIAMRMSWAAERETTRPEDLAYCLMGMFDVNMPTLYGEGGPRAFMRLQQEIVKYSDDESIFAWTAHTSEQRGLFARSPSEFRYSGEIQASDELEEGASPYLMTNRGLHIELPLVKYMGRTLAILRCRRKEALLGIYLRHEKGDQYTREFPEQVVIWYPWQQSQHPAHTKGVYVKECDPSIKWNRFLSEVTPERNIDIKLLSSLKKFIHFKMPGKATSSTRGVLLHRRQECFALFIGVQEHGMWSYLVTKDPRVQELAYMHYKTPLPVEAIGQIWNELSKYAAQCRWEMGDRVEKSLNSKDTVFVTTREINKNTPQSRHVAEVGIITRSHQWDEEDESYYVPSEYDFFVNWAQAITVSLKEAYPDNIHKGKTAAVSLMSANLKEENPCVLVFTHKKTSEAFAVVIKLLDNAIWSDIFSIEARETAESVSQRIKDRAKKSTNSLVIAGNTFEVSAGRKECLAKGHDLWAHILESDSSSGTVDDPIIRRISNTNPSELQPNQQPIHGILSSVQLRTDEICRRLNLVTD